MTTKLTAQACSSLLQPRRLATIGIVMALAAPWPASGSGDPRRGERAFQKCYACHSVAPAEDNLPGPNLHRVIGRIAGALPGYMFSPAMIRAGREAGLVWTEDTLDRFLRDAERFIPETNMAFVGIGDPGERADVIAFIRRAGE